MRKFTARFPKRRLWLEPKYIGLVMKYQALLDAQARMDSDLSESREVIETTDDLVEKDKRYAIYARQLKQAATLGTKVNGARNRMVAELERTKL